MERLGPFEVLHQVRAHDVQIFICACSAWYNYLVVVDDIHIKYECNQDELIVPGHFQGKFKL